MKLEFARFLALCCLLLQTNAARGENIDSALVAERVEELWGRGEQFVVRDEIEELYRSQPRYVPVLVAKLVVTMWDGARYEETLNLAAPLLETVKHNPHIFHEQFIKGVGAIVRDCQLGIEWSEKNNLRQIDRRSLYPISNVTWQMVLPYARLIHLAPRVTILDDEETLSKELPPPSLEELDPNLKDISEEEIVNIAADWKTPFSTRESAIWEIMKVGQSRSIPILLGLLQHDNPEVTMLSAAAISTFGKPTIPLLIELIWSEPPPIRVDDAVWALMRIAPEGTPEISRELERLSTANRRGDRAAKRALEFYSSR